VLVGDNRKYGSTYHITNYAHVGVGKVFVIAKVQVELILTGYYHLVNLKTARPLATSCNIPIDIGLARQHLVHVCWLSMANPKMLEMQCAT
jgi:hypothetical protein